MVNSARLSIGRILLIAFVLCFAYGQLLIEHAWNLWSREYFRFFPIFLISALWLMCTRIEFRDRLNRSQWWIGPISFVFAMFNLTCAVCLRSPWFAAASLLLFGDSLLAAFTDARSAWRLLALLIPLPLGVDSRLVQQLQLVSSKNAGRLLDLSDVPHLMRGNVVQLSDQRFFVDEACSGIGSVYLLIAVTMYCIVSARMRMVIAIPLLLSVVWWTIVANAARIFFIATAHHRYAVDWRSACKTDPPRR